MVVLPVFVRAGATCKAMIILIDRGSSPVEFYKTDILEVGTVEDWLRKYEVEIRATE
ncbi:MAG: hypothetical protein WBX01_04555 [Nitrososphaeraceae archaeon]